MRVLSGLSEISADHDGIICDVWGVLHNGREPYLKAAEALRRFRSERGPVVLLSNAPRLVPTLLKQFEAIGVPTDCFDAIVTSGMAARGDLIARGHGRRLKMFHLGPERDGDVFDGLDIESVAAQDAEIVLCTGLFDDDHETPADYEERLTALQGRGLTMLCANPDLVVQRGGQLVYCAGALAARYEQLGGTVAYFGKPHPAIYDVTLDTLRKVSGRTIAKPLAIGDAMATDLKGANAMGVEALFIAHGIHAAELGEVTTESLSQLFDKAGVRASAAMRELVW
ncbi:MAG TPA: TIGR01459 family HAD-type hydrolase [Rhizomicrobium sp.]|nr:TIGR01459 family HAD-type hydrolase [Rhizomicrobium sp.]